ncbi:hypothetical protein Hanom_Chr04g00355321 [Helianthus anomalus]
MESIKSNHHPNQYPPLDHAEMKSQSYKLYFLTVIVAVLGGLLASSVHPTLLFLLLNPCCHNCTSSRLFY